MSGYLVAPIAIEIMIPIAVIIPVLFLPIIPGDIGPNLLDIIPAILTPMSYLYYILIATSIAQGYLVDEYLFPKPHRRFLQPQLKQNIFRDSFRVYTHPLATLSEIIAGRSPKRFFEVGGYEKPLIQYETTKKNTLC